MIILMAVLWGLMAVVSMASSVLSFNLWKDYGGRDNVCQGIVMAGVSVASLVVMISIIVKESA